MNWCIFSDCESFTSVLESMKSVRPYPCTWFSHSALVGPCLFMWYNWAWGWQISCKRTAKRSFSINITTIMTRHISKHFQAFPNLRCRPHVKYRCSNVNSKLVCEITSVSSEPKWRSFIMFVIMCSPRALKHFIERWLRKRPLLWRFLHWTAHQWQCKNGDEYENNEISNQFNSLARIFDLGKIQDGHRFLDRQVLRDTDSNDNQCVKFVLHWHDGHNDRNINCLGINYSLCHVTSICKSRKISCKLTA